jgi:plastocyanin
VTGLPRRPLAFGAVPALLAILAGCGPGTAIPAPVGAYADLHPSINPNHHGTNPDAFFVPDPIRVYVGQTITWTDRDNDLHDVTSVDGLFASYPLTQGGTFRWTPTKPGTYPYFCTMHPEMHGFIIVTAK